MNSAEKYLKERINFLSDERVMLLTKIDETDFEIKGIKYKITELKNSIDDTFEVFSPRTKKNDFTKNEIECLEKEIDALTSLRDEHSENAEKILEDIEIIKDVLRDNFEEDKDDFLEESDVITDNFLPDNKNTDSLIMKNERFLLAGKIEEKTLKLISNLIYKCEICGKVMEVDTGRAKLEIEMMNGALNELYNNIKIITTDLRKSLGENLESARKVPVKKLSKDNLHKEN